MSDNDINYMKESIQLAHKCQAVESAYNVGAVLVKDGKVLSTGYSRELPGNTHAEECCLAKLEDVGIARGATMYTTMEPCSKRLSSLRSCTDRILEAGIGRVVIGAAEPTLFVACEGTRILRDAGIEITYLEGFTQECLAPNSHLNI